MTEDLTVPGQKWQESASTALLYLVAAAPVIGLISARAMALLLVLSVVFAAVAVWPDRAALAHRARSIPRWIILAVAGFLVWAAMSASWSISTDRAIDSLAKLALVLLAGTILYPALSSMVFSRWRWFPVISLCGGGVAACLIVLVTRVLDWPGIGGGVEIPIIGKVLLSWFNQSLAILILWAWLAAALIEKKWRRWSWLPAILLIAPAAATDYGVGLATIAVSLGVYVFILFLGQQGGKFLVAGIVAYTLLMPLVSLQMPSYDDYDFKVVNIEKSIAHRLMIWQYTSERIREKPLTGWGLGNARHLPESTRIRNPILGGKPRTIEQMPLHPHNAPLQFWVELGVLGGVGLAAFLGALGLAINRARLDPWRRAHLFSAYTAMVAIMSASYGVWSTWWMSSIALVAVLMLASLRWLALPEKTLSSPEV